MMKGQLAGLMKQAQAMQDNLKKAQDELATIEVEGQSGAGLVKVTMTCKHDVKRVAIDPSLLGRRQGHARGPGRRRVQRRHAPRRGGEQEKMGKLTAGMPPAAGHEAAVLSAAHAFAPRPKASGSGAAGLTPARSNAPGRGTAPPARRRRQVGAAHGLAPAAARPRRRAADRRVAAAGGGPGAPLRALPHLHRGSRSAASASTRRATGASWRWSRRRPTRRRSSAPAAIAACTSC